MTPTAARRVETEVATGAATEAATEAIIDNLKQSIV